MRESVCVFEKVRESVFERERESVCVRERVCVCVYTCERARVCVCVCVYACAMNLIVELFSTLHQTTAEFRQRISNGTCPFCVTVGYRDL